MNNLRIFIAEDHETVREGLRLIIDGQADMEVCGECGDGRTAVKMAQELQPDVVVMDDDAGIKRSEGDPKTQTTLPADENFNLDKPHR